MKEKEMQTEALMKNSLAQTLLYYREKGYDTAEIQLTDDTRWTVLLRPLFFLQTLVCPKETSPEREMMYALRPDESGRDKDGRVPVRFDVSSNQFTVLKEEEASARLFEERFLALLRDGQAAGEAWVKNRNKGRYVFAGLTGQMIGKELCDLSKADPIVRMNASQIVCSASDLLVFSRAYPVFDLRFTRTPDRLSWCGSFFATRYGMDAGKLPENKKPKDDAAIQTGAVVTVIPKKQTMVLRSRTVCEGIIQGMRKAREEEAERKEARHAENRA